MTNPDQIQTVSDSLANHDYELSKWQKFRDYAKQILGRSALIITFATAGSFANVSEEASAVETGGYPYAEAPCYPPSIDKVTNRCNGYDWRVPTRDAQGNIIGWPEWTERGFGARNCTDWAALRVKQLTGIEVPYGAGMGHGRDWDDRGKATGYTVDQTPEVGDIAQNDNAAGGLGHVGVVEEVSKDSTGKITSIKISQYNGSGNGMFANIYYNADANGKFWLNTNQQWDDFIDVNGMGVGGNGTSLGTGSSESAYTYPDGTFLKVNESGAIYRMVGGAPVRIYNQGALPDFNGSVTAISHEQLGKLPSYPNDEGDIISLVEAGGAKYRMVGGAPVRIFNCAALPGNCSGAINVNFESLVQMDHMRPRPKDGSVINIAEAGGSGVYQFVGGAPVRQFNWGAIPNFGNAISVNHQSLAQLDHMNPVPEDGSVVSIVEAGGSGLYRFVGGAPIRLFNWGAIPDCCGTVVNINEQSLATLDHMNARPADGSLINIQEAGGSGIYRFAGGAPLRLFNWGIIPGMKPAVNVNAQSLGSLDHMNANPENGEFIASIETGVVYRVAGGAALRLYNHGAIPGYNGATFVNQETLNTFDHLKPQPVDDTVLQGVTSKSYWKIQGGKRTQVAAQNGAVIVDEQTITNFPAL